MEFDRFRKNGTLTEYEKDYLSSFGNRLNILGDGSEKAKFKEDLQKSLEEKFNVKEKLSQLQSSKNIWEAYRKYNFTNEDIALIQLYIKVTTGANIKVDGILGKETIRNIKKAESTEVVNMIKSYDLETRKNENKDLLGDLMNGINSNKEFKAGVDLILGNIEKSNVPVMKWYNESLAKQGANKYEFFFFNYFTNLNFINFLQKQKIGKDGSAIDTGNNNLQGFAGTDGVSKSAFQKIKEKIDQLRNFKENQKRLQNEHPKLAPIISNIYIDKYDSSSVKNHINDLIKLPAELLNWIANKNIIFYISDGTVTSWDTFNDLRKKKPRGRSDGSTWEIVPGLFSPLENVVVAGKDNIHGSASLLLHELGHGIGNNSRVSTSETMRKFHIQFYDKLKSYYKQGGPGGEDGMDEFTAESMADFYKLSKDEFIAKFSKEYWDYRNRIVQNPTTA